MSLWLGLESYGYQCVEAQDGLVALHELRSRCFDAVLTDFCMPFLDGLGLVQHVYQDHTYGDPILIMMTGNAIQDIAPLALALGVRGILEKPCSAFDVDQLIRASMDSPGLAPKAA